jgi:hypothetical protein
MTFELTVNAAVFTLLHPGWYIFWDWLKPDAWAALGSMLGGLAVLISSVSLPFLAYQSFAARDTLTMQKKERNDIDFVKAQLAYMTLMKTRDHLITLDRRLIRVPPRLDPHVDLFPTSWPEAVVLFYKLVPDSIKTSIKYGIALTSLDSEVRDYLLAPEDEAELLAEVKTKAVIAYELSEELLKAIGHLEIHDPQSGCDRERWR